MALKLGRDEVRWAGAPAAQEGKAGKQQAGEAR